ncbi:hypothetical protein [Telmatospirillum siberiense]|uniref:hypothetical protein n=1 Tax=Telmatospirillum siberiense TaxID=382514 RepID=UPI0013041412|nr:hypothetical protein [Telmatospirillum siberiense]
MPEIKQLRAGTLDETGMGCALVPAWAYADTEMSATLSWAFTLKQGGLGCERSKLNRI